jgi:hypothetical protein
MKVVCIKIPPTFTTLKIEVGEIYTAFHREYTILTDQKATTLFIKDNLNNVIPCDALDRGKYFITLEKWRDSKLSELGI